jgi:hypothetical protein
MGKGAVAALKQAKFGICIKQLIKRQLIDGDPLQQAYSGTPGHKAGLFRFCG